MPVKGEYRRCCLYVVLGFSLVAALGPVLQPAQPWGLVACVAVFVVVAAVFWLYLQTWRLRIDRTGLARRRLGLWSSWTWHHFAAGQVRTGESPLSFRCAARPWWDRWLFLEIVAPEAAVTELARLLRSLIPPPPAEMDRTQAVAVPAEIKIGLWLAGDLQLTAQGLAYRRGRDSRWLSWDDVLTLRLIRERVQKAIAHRLELQPRVGAAISGRVSSIRIDGRRIWAIGQRHADWPLRLQALMPPRCWQVFQTEGDLQSRAEGEFRLAHWRQKLTVARRIRNLLPPLFLALSGLCFVPKLIACWNAQFFPAWWKGVALACLALTMVMPSFLIWVFPHDAAQIFERKLRETEEELSRLPFRRDT